MGPDRRSLAIYLLVDRSGSVSTLNHHVRLALMTPYLACQELGVPLAAAYFGDGGQWPKAMITGYQGHTGAEYPAWGLRKAEKGLLHRLERLRVVIVPHDG